MTRRQESARDTLIVIIAKKGTRRGNCCGLDVAKANALLHERMPHIADTVDVRQLCRNFPDDFRYDSSRNEVMRLDQTVPHHRHESARSKAESDTSNAEGIKRDDGGQASKQAQKRSRNSKPQEPRNTLKNLIKEYGGLVRVEEATLRLQQRYPACRCGESLVHDLCERFSQELHRFQLSGSWVVICIGQGDPRNDVNMAPILKEVEDMLASQTLMFDFQRAGDSTHAHFSRLVCDILIWILKKHGSNLHATAACEKVKTYLPFVEGNLDIGQQCDLYPQELFLVNLSGENVVFLVESFMHDHEDVMSGLDTSSAARSTIDADCEDAIMNVLLDACDCLTEILQEHDGELDSAVASRLLIERRPQCQGTIDVSVGKLLRWFPCQFDRKSLSSDTKTFNIVLVDEEQLDQPSVGAAARDGKSKKAARRGRKAKSARTKQVKGSGSRSQAKRGTNAGATRRMVKPVKPGSIPAERPHRSDTRTGMQSVSSLLNRGKQGGDQAAEEHPSKK